MRKNTKYINIDNYEKLIKILQKNNLLTSNKLLKEKSAYCKKGTYNKVNYSLTTIYSGLLINKLHNLNNYEIVLLMLGKDSFSYDVQRGKNGYFRVIEYKMKNRGKNEYYRISRSS